MRLLEKLEQNRNLTLEEWQALIQKQSEYQKEAEKRANILREQPNTSDAPTESIAQSISTLSILLNFLTP